MVKQLFTAIFRDLGFSKKSVELRVDLLERMIECERRGIDPIAEVGKALRAATFYWAMPALPTISIPTLRLPKLELPRG